MIGFGMKQCHNRLLTSGCFRVTVPPRSLEAVVGCVALMNVFQNIAKKSVSPSDARESVDQGLGELEKIVTSNDLRLVRALESIRASAHSLVQMLCPDGS
eukprot:c20204_g1_i6.p1 GENE.c20204_g1_i6~~c20204_g1_i6.p1  ORF type:complete len:100 (-),score=10.66 c20204_g1_i6:45-344(-)